MKIRNYSIAGFNLINCANGIVLSFGSGSMSNKISDSLTSVSVIAS